MEDYKLYSGFMFLASGLDQAIADFEKKFNRSPEWCIVSEEVYKEYANGARPYPNVRLIAGAMAYDSYFCFGPIEKKDVHVK